MGYKNDYTVIVFFVAITPKKWSYVHKIKGFVQFLDSKHPSWIYFNVYERRTGNFLKRFDKDSLIPNHIPIGSNS